MFPNETFKGPCTLTELELLHDTWTYKIYLSLTPFIVGIGLMGNIFTVCVFFLTDLKRQSVSIITIALAIADSFVLLIPVSILWLETISTTRTNRCFSILVSNSRSVFSFVNYRRENFRSRLFRFDLHLLFELADGLYCLRTVLCCLVTAQQQEYLHSSENLSACDQHRLHFDFLFDMVYLCR